MGGVFRGAAVGGVSPRRATIAQYTSSPITKPAVGGVSLWNLLNYVFFGPVLIFLNILYFPIILNYLVTITTKAMVCH